MLGLYHHFIPIMGGDRPRNHIAAKYVTVIDHHRRRIMYFCLDAKGRLIFEDGVPKMYKFEPFRDAAPVVPPEPQPSAASPPPPASPASVEAEVGTAGGERLNEHGDGLLDCDHFLDGDDFNAYEGWNPFLM
jgi:hypothetical protein